VYFLLIVVLPFAVLLCRRSRSLFDPVVAGAAESHARPVPVHLQLPDLPRTVWNTLLLSFGCATLIMLVTSVICWIV